MSKKRVRIVYYSGTGCTERVARCFETMYKQSDYEVSLHRLYQNTEYEDGDETLLILLFAVHALNAPEPVYQWIERLEQVQGFPAVVISVSGGGEVSPNTACRVSTIKRLERKGYHVIYEKMLVMPSNAFAATKEPLARMLLDVLPQKVTNIIRDVENGVRLRSKPHPVDRFLSHVGELEKLGAREFGKRIKPSELCSGCGWCANHCPSGNITLKNNKPVFGNRCHFCLSCIYGCPNKALQPGFGKFIVIKEGFRLEEIENLQPINDFADVEKLAKGYLWSGVRKYLLKNE